MTKLDEVTAERDDLYRLLAALVWDQPKHVLHVSRGAWQAMGRVGDYTLTKADGPDGTIRLTAKFDPVHKLGDKLPEET